MLNQDLFTDHITYFRIRLGLRHRSLPGLEDVLDGAVCGTAVGLSVHADAPGDPVLADRTRKVREGKVRYLSEVRGQLPFRPVVTTTNKCVLIDSTAQESFPEQHFSYPLWFTKLCQVDPLTCGCIAASLQVKYKQYPIQRPPYNGHFVDSRLF